MTLLVAITQWEVEPWLERFRRVMPDRPIVQLGEPFDRRAVDYVAAWKHPPGSLAGLPNLDLVFSLGAGVDHLVGDPRLPDVPVVRVVDDDLTHRMSEYVVLHCLAHLRQFRRYLDQQAARQWIDDRHQPAARDVRVGILGYGVIGRDAGTKLAMLGFDVAGWSRTKKPSDGPEVFAGADQLDAFLARTDILVALLPLTDETRGLLDRGLFGKLARNGRLGGPILINAGRGGLQVEPDILAALADGSLKAATLDVFETEPLPTDSPLWDHPSVTLTPHNAGMSDPDVIAERIAEQIRRFEAGEMPRNLVDPRSGY